MERFSLVICSVLLTLGLVNCYGFDHFQSFKPWQGQSSFNIQHGPNFGYWPFSHKSLIPTFRRASIGDDDDSSISAEHFTQLPSDISDDREPLEVDAISGPINGGPGDTAVEIETNLNQPQKPIFPSFGEFELANGGEFSAAFNPILNPFFNSFIGSLASRRTPWWRGPNVCTEKEEDVSSDSEASTEVGQTKSSQSFEFGIHLSLNSCVEKTHKHVCKTIINDHGSKKTTSITRQCCHGFGRPANADVHVPCEKVDLRSLEETAEKLGGKEFIHSMQKNEMAKEVLQNVTVFLPLDAAYTEFAEEMFESNLVVVPARRRRGTKNPLLDSFTSKDLALNHIVNEWVNIEDIENEQLLVSEYNNLTIRMNVFPRPPNVQGYEYPYRYTANCAPLVKINQLAENGMIHVVDRVLSPVQSNLMDLIRERSDMAVLRTVLEKTDLAEQLEKDTKHFTVFAPTDDAFEKLDAHIMRTIKEGNGCALNILKNHILEMTFCSIAVVDDANTGAINSLGLKMNFERAAMQTNENEIQDLTGAKSILINGLASVTESDIMATNGVLHVVDMVLPTESGMPFSTMLESRNLTIFKQLLDASGMDDEFDGLMNVTFFTPIDKAFDGSMWKNQLEENPEQLKDNEELKEFLKYHIAKPLTKTCELSEQILPTESADGSGIRVNLYSTHSVFNNVMNRATVNCARLVHFDEDSCGSVVHQIDRVLEKPTMTLLEKLEANENYSQFLRLIKEANLTALLSDVNQNLTVLVPNNDIFGETADLYDELLKKPKRLEYFTKLHILDDVLCCAGIVQTEWPFIRLVKTLNNIELKIARDRRPKIQNAGITKCDIISKNGIILEVNDFITINRPKPHHEVPFTSFLDL